MPKHLNTTDAGGNRIINVSPPVAGSDAATRAYVDSAGGTAFVQGAAPVSPPATYLWVQTGLGDGNDMTFWVEDGS